MRDNSDGSGLQDCRTAGVSVSDMQVFGLYAKALLAFVESFARLLGMCLIARWVTGEELECYKPNDGKGKKRGQSKTKKIA